MSENMMDGANLVNAVGEGHIQAPVSTSFERRMVYALNEWVIVGEKDKWEFLINSPETQDPHTRQVLKRALDCLPALYSGLSKSELARLDKVRVRHQL